MPIHFFPLTTLTQHLEDGTYISEALNFPGISRFHTKEDSAKHNARVNADAILKSDYAAKKTAAWRESVNVKIHYIKIEREDGCFYAYVPALHIAVLSRKEADFQEKIKTEILAALRRDGWTKSLRFVHGTRSNRVLLDSTDADFTKYELPEDLIKRDSVKFQTERRVYDLPQNKVKGLFLEETFSLENVDLQTVLIEAIETNLIKTSENLMN